jgi:hypothetical protein
MNPFIFSSLLPLHLCAFALNICPSASLRLCVKIAPALNCSVYPDLPLPVKTDSGAAIPCAVDLALGW